MVSVVRARARLLIVATVSAVAIAGLTLVSSPAANAAPPVIIGPAGGEVVTQIPTLSWQRQASAPRYEIQVSVSDTFATKLVDTNTYNSQYTPVAQLPAGQLYWRVRPFGGTDLDWADATFTRGALDVPTMLTPTGSLPQPQSPPLLSWTPVQGALAYNLQVSSDADFIDPTKIVSYNPVKVTSGISPVQQVPGTYYARVRATMGTNLFSNYSAPITFTIEGLAAAERTSPPNAGSVTDAVVDWKPVPGAATYQVQMDDDINFQSLAVDVTGITGTRFAPPKTVDNDTYYWRVRPIDAAGNFRGWMPADIGEFTRSWAGQVKLEYPAHEAIVGDPFFYQWSPSERTSSAQEDLALSSSYTLEVSTSPTFLGAPVMRCNTTSTTWVPGSSLNGNQQCQPQASGTYYWRVFGHDDFSTARPGTEPGQAEVRRFTYRPEVPQLVAPVKDPETDAVPTVEIPTLSWTPVGTAARYRVTINNSLGGSFVATTAATSYTPTVSLGTGNFTWQVSTVSQEGRVGTQFIFDQGEFNLVALTPGSAPKPLPLNSPSGRRFPTLQWQSVTGAATYSLHVKPVGSVAFTQVDDELPYPAAESLDGTFLAPGDYDWFVKAYNASGGLISSSGLNEADWGTLTINPLEVIDDEDHYAALAGTFLPDDPEQPALDLGADACRTQILNAANQSECVDVRNTPVLRWPAHADTGSYLLYVAKDKAMTNPVYDLDNNTVFDPIVLQQPMWSPPNALPDSQAGTAYFYKVVSCAYVFCEALGDAQHSFDKRSRQVELKPVQETSIAAPAPSDCVDNPLTPTPLVECQNDITLSWDDFRTTEKSADPGNPLSGPGRTEARSYIVQTATDSSFNDIIESVEVDQTTFTSFGTTYPEGTVYWRVQAVDANGNRLEWSKGDTPEDPCAFCKFDKKSPAPVLESPSSSPPVTGDQYFTWHSLPFAARYQVEIYKDNDTTFSPANRVVGPATVGSRAVSLTNRLAQSAIPYIWRVRRLDAANRAGAWTSGVFTVSEPTTTLTAPADGASVPPSDGLFSWSAVGGAESYRFERRLAGTLTVIEPAVTRATSWAPQSPITGGNWEWRVIPIDASGNNMTATGWRPFSVTDTVVANAGVGITGSGRVGTPLTINPEPVWNFGPAVTTTYQWYRGNTAIGGETGPTYTVTTADLTRVITVRAVGARPGYISGGSTSNGITGIAGNAPVAVVDVGATGTGKVGSLLTATPPTWDSDQVTSSYRWQRDGVDITGTTGDDPTYTVIATDVGKQITVKATGSRPGYDPGTSISAPVPAVLGDAPDATTDVTISGPSAKVGQTWTVAAPTWDTAGVTTTYQWFRDDVAITGATKATYTLATADIGASVAVEATGSKAGYAPGTSTSNAVVPEQLDTNTNIAPPTVSGIAAARETLTVNPGTWPSGTTYTYQWFVNGLAVARETKATYVVRTRDAGLKVSVRVTGSKAGFLPGTAFSPEQTVKKLPTATTAGLEEPVITKRARAILNVNVDVVDLGVPLGKVQVKEGSKVLATVQLKNDSRGNVTIRLKKLKPGKHKLVVTYLGSAATETSKAKKVKLIVLKK